MTDQPKDEGPAAFDARSAKQRTEQIRRVLAAHDIPDDRDTAVAMFVEGVNRCCAQYGPRAMPAFAASFVQAWRDAEASIYSELVINEVIKAALRDAPTDKEH